MVGASAGTHRTYRRCSARAHEQVAAHGSPGPTATSGLLPHGREATIGTVLPRSTRRSLVARRSTENRRRQGGASQFGRRGAPRAKWEGGSRPWGRAWHAPPGFRGLGPARRGRDSEPSRDFSQRAKPGVCRRSCRVDHGVHLTRATSGQVECVAATGNVDDGGDRRPSRTLAPCPEMATVSPAIDPGGTEPRVHRSLRLRDLGAHDSGRRHVAWVRPEDRSEAPER
jgi:hypothetical protein